MRQSAFWVMTLGAILCGSLGWAHAHGQGASSNLVGANVAVAPGADGVRPVVGEVVARMLEKNKERLAALEHYESERTYKVEYRGTGGEHHAELHVQMVYTGPNKKQFTVESESGSKFLCEKVLRKLVEGEQEAAAKSNQMQMTLGPDNYDAALVGEEVVATAGGPVRTWVLRVTPKNVNKFTYRGQVWVSEDDYAVVKIQGEPAKSPSWWINHAAFESDYVRRAGVWLPEKNISSSHVRIGGEAKLTIEYGTYPVVTARAVKPAPLTEANLLR